MTAREHLRRAPPLLDESCRYNGFIPHFILTEADGGRLAECEVLLATTTLVMAGIDSPWGVMSVGTPNLAEHSDAQAAVATDPPRLHEAIEESLCLSNPDVYDIARKPLGHLGFGGGVPVCLGTGRAGVDALVDLSRPAAAGAGPNLASPGGQHGELAPRGVVISRRIVPDQGALMEPSVARAMLNVMIHAALADGQKAEAERGAIRDAAESLTGQAGGAALAGVYQDVLLKRVTLAEAVATLRTLEHRQLAYEMAVCVCDSDGVQSAAEQQFLASLRQALALDGGDPALAEAAQADSIAAAAAGAAAPQVALPATPAPVATHDAELDKRILNTAILCGALELLPQAWASMAIIPLQVRMVYVIGQAHGTQLDQGHIKEFIATVGVGLTSQYVEQIGRKLIGGLVGKAAGRLLGGLSSAGVGMATSFATTYALGQVARRYYSGGRVMSTELLKRSFQDMTGQAKTLQQQYLPAMRERASTLSATEVVELVRR